MARKAASAAALRKAAKRPGKLVAGRKPGSGPTPLEWQALSIAAKEAAKHRGALTVGEGQPVDVTLRIAGCVDVCPDSTATIRRSPTVTDLIIGMLLATPEPERSPLADRLAELWPTIGAAQLPPGLAQIAENLLASLQRQEQQPKRGAITGAVAVQKISARKARK